MEGLDVGPELIHGLVVGNPLHHHAARVEVRLGRPVELLRVKDPGARAVDRGRRICHRQVVGVRCQLDVIAAIRDDQSAVGIRQDICRVGVVVAEHAGYGGHELDPFDLQSVDQGAAVARTHAERDLADAPGLRTEDGRQERHETGVHGERRHGHAADPQLLAAPRVCSRNNRGDLILSRAGDGGSLAVERVNSRVEHQAVGDCKQDDGRDRDQPADEAATEPEPGPDVALGGEESHAQTRIDHGQQDDGSGRAEPGNQEERHDEGANDRAGRVDADQETRAGTHAAVVVRHEGGAHGEGDPENESRGQHRQHETGNRVRLEREAGFDAQAEHDQHCQQQLGHAEQEDGAPRPGEERRVDRGTKGDTDEEAGKDESEDVRGHIRPGRRQARPQGLVAERSQAGHEGHGQRQPGTRDAVGKA